MPGSWDSLWDRRRVRKPASLHLVGSLLILRYQPKRARSGALLFNGGHYNRSALNPAIRVARARRRLGGYRPSRTSELRNSKPAILRNFKPPLTPSKASPIAPIWPKQLAEYPGYHVRVIPEDTAAPGSQHQYVTPVIGGQPEQFCGAPPENAFDLRGQARLILPNGSGIGRRSRDEVDEVGLLQQKAIIAAKHRAAR